ncbi:hypothetical protein K0M31_012972, partial [Melipona bicolor]
MTEEGVEKEAGRPKGEQSWSKSCEPRGMLEKLYNFDNLKSTELPCPAVVKSVRGGGGRANKTWTERGSEQNGGDEQIGAERSRRRMKA